MLKSAVAAEFLEAVHSCQPVLGLTHNFYRYPARFSPLFARTAIKAFTQPDDFILDPFMGGGTTLVEARVAGRHAIGVDVSELAVFIARAKTMLLSENDLSTIQNWASELNENLNLCNSPVRAKEWIERGYQRNISGKSTWPIRKTLELALAQAARLHCNRQRRFARCVLLKTGQWALDCRSKIPSAKEFRMKFFANLVEMSEAAKEFSVFAREADRLYETRRSFRTLCLHRSAIGIDNEPKMVGISAPKLILTSPPYPGVHVLYHRWQVQGRKETPAPFWVADCLDGHGETFYALGNRKQHDLTNYFNQIYDAFVSLARISDTETITVQLLAFSDPAWQLSKYLDVMERAGFSEIKFPVFSNSPNGRLWRHVPNRKWYAEQKGTIASSKEVILFHRLAQA